MTNEQFEELMEHVRYQTSMIETVMSTVAAHAIMSISEVGGSSARDIIKNIETHVKDTLSHDT